MHTLFNSLRAGSVNILDYGEMKKKEKPRMNLSMFDNSILISCVNETSAKCQLPTYTCFSLLLGNVHVEIITINYSACSNMTSNRTWCVKGNRKRTMSL